MSLADGNTLTRARCLRAALHDPDTDEGLAGFVLLARALKSLT